MPGVAGALGAVGVNNVAMQLENTEKPSYRAKRASKRGKNIGIVKIVDMV